MSWFSRFFGKKEKSGSIAKSRLQMVLTHDRSDISPGVLEAIKDDIVAVIANHLAIDPENVVVDLDNSSNQSRLVAQIPLQQNPRP